MEGKELLKLLDFVDDLNKKADDFEKEIQKANTESGEAEFKLKASLYKKIADTLEKLLREVNS